MSSRSLVIISWSITILSLVIGIYINNEELVFGALFLSYPFSVMFYHGYRMEVKNEQQKYRRYNRRK